MTTEVYQHKMVNAATVGDNGFVVVTQQANLEVGEPQATGIRVFVRSTYPASYNFVVRNMNGINPQTNTKKKHSMRGGHLLLYRYVVLLAILLCFAFSIASVYVKPCAAVPFVLSVIYVALTIYNIVVFIRNRPLINPLLAKQVPRGVIAGGHINEFYTMPLNATVQTGVFAAFIDPAVVAAAVRRNNIQLTQIRMMLYDDRYLRRCRFPKEVVIHLIVFVILFCVAIFCVSLYPTK